MHFLLHKVGILKVMLTWVMVTPKLLVLKHLMQGVVIVHADSIMLEIRNLDSRQLLAISLSSIFTS